MSKTLGNVPSGDINLENISTENPNSQKLTPDRILNPGARLTPGEISQEQADELQKVALAAQQILALSKEALSTEERNRTINPWKDNPQHRIPN